MLASFSRRLRAIHRDQKGLEALQVVIILAIAAIVIAAIFYFWGNYQAGNSKGIKGWVQNNLTVIFGWSAKDVHTGGDVNDGAAAQ